VGKSSGCEASHLYVLKNNEVVGIIPLMELDKLVSKITLKPTRNCRFLFSIGLFDLDYTNIIVADKYRGDLITNWVPDHAFNIAKPKIQWD
jgi:hypothetical protein